MLIKDVKLRQIIYLTAYRATVKSFLLVNKYHPQSIEDFVTQLDLELTKLDNIYDIQS